MHDHRDTLELERELGEPFKLSRDYELTPHQPWTLAPGYLEPINVDNFAGNATPVVKIAGGRWQQLLSVRLSLATDGTVANRRPQILIADNDGKRQFLLTTAVVVAATSSKDYYWRAGWPTSENDGDGNQLEPLVDIPSPPGTTYTLRVRNGVAGDTVTNCQLIVRRWIDALPRLFGDRELERMRAAHEARHQIEAECELCSSRPGMQPPY